MKRLLPFYVLAVAVVAVGAVAFGIPTSSLWILGFLVLCPLMMMFMMGGMHGGGGDGNNRNDGQNSGDATGGRDRHSRHGH